MLKFTVYTSFQNSILELLFCHARHLSMKGLIPYWKILWNRDRRNNFILNIYVVEKLIRKTEHKRFIK